MMTRYVRVAIWMLAAVLLLQACSSPSGENGLAAAFDPEDPKEYGIRGIYLGQNIKEAMEQLQPTKADFMDAVTRESYTADQLAAGAGTMVMGLLLVDETQLMVTVKQGVLHSIVVGGIPREKAAAFATNRGLAAYDGPEKIQQLYGQAAGQSQEITLQGSKYKLLLRLHDNQLIGYRFDTVE